MVFAATILGVSILGLGVLFYIKHWEERHARIFMPEIRLSADQRALELKALLQRGQAEFRKLGPTTLRISRTLLHDLALFLAALSRASERQAHRLADLVSHKHAFQRRESKNQFLKQVSEVPIRTLRESVPPPSVPTASVPTPEMPRPVVQVPDMVVTKIEPAASRPLPESAIVADAEEDEDVTVKPAAPIANSNVQIVTKAKKKRAAKKKTSSEFSSSND